MNFSTIHILEINLFLESDFLIFFGIFSVINQSKGASNQKVSCPPLEASSPGVFHFLNFFSTSFGGTLLAVRDWVHQGSPSAAVGFGPKASVFAARAGQVSSALPQGRATPKLLRESEGECYPSPFQYPQSLALRYAKSFGSMALVPMSATISEVRR